MKCQKNRNNNKYISWPVNELDVVNVPENTRIASSARTCSLACGGAGLDIELVCEVSNKANFYLSSQKTLGKLFTITEKVLLGPFPG